MGPAVGGREACSFASHIFRPFSSARGAGENLDRDPTAAPSSASSNHSPFLSTISSLYGRIPWRHAVEEGRIWAGSPVGGGAPVGDGRICGGSPSGDEPRRRSSREVASRSPPPNSPALPSFSPLRARRATPGNGRAAGGRGAARGRCARGLEELFPELAVVCAHLKPAAASMGETGGPGAARSRVEAEQLGTGALVAWRSSSPSSPSSACTSNPNGHRQSSARPGKGGAANFPAPAAFLPVLLSSHPAHQHGTANFWWWPPPEPR
jgi:hypothetical protein